MIKAIIFDCFGVLLVDALSVLRDELKQTDPEKYQELVDILHASHRGLIVPAESNKKAANLLGLSEQEYREYLQNNETKNRELLNYIKQLNKDYKTAILSNIGIDSLRHRFSEEELSLFDAVVTSGELGYAKPDARIYEITAKNLGINMEEAVFIDDNKRFCEAAKSLGMQTILYKNFIQFQRDLTSVLV